MEGVEEESIVQTCGLADLPGDLLDRCLCQLNLSNLVLCEQACSTLREGSLRTQGRVQELCWVDLISHDVGCAWTRHGSSPHEETPTAPAGAAAREARANRELAVDGEVAWKIAVCKRVLLGLPSVLSGVRLEGLRTLNLSATGWYREWHNLLNDTTIAAFPSCPQLENLLLLDTDVTDEGIAHMAKACPSLILFDFTYCNRTTFHSVVTIRALCPSIQAVRRLPEELEGHFHCPWGEIHSYYADGSFEFARDVESIGWVCYLQKHVDSKNGGFFWSDRLRYINAEEGQTARYNRAGVLLKPIESCPNEILIVQDRYQRAPPSEFPAIDPDSIPSGSTVILSDWREGAIMCSRMTMTRFTSAEALGGRPPKEVLNRIETYLSERKENTPPSSSWAGEYEDYHTWLDLRDESELRDLLRLESLHLVTFNRAVWEYILTLDAAGETEETLLEPPT